MTAGKKIRVKAPQAARGAGTDAPRENPGKASGKKEPPPESGIDYRALFEQARDSILLLELPPDGIPVIRDANAAALRLHGWRREELLGKPITFLDAGPPESLLRERVSLIAAAGDAVFEARRRRKDGPVIDMEVSLIAITAGGRRLLLDIARDITRRKRAEDSLRESLEQHSIVVQTSIIGFWLVDRQGRLLEANETYCRMSGYSARELSAMNISDLESARTGEATAVRMRKIMARGTDRFESRHRRKDGSVFDVEVNVQYWPAFGGRFVGFVQDITGRKRKEREILERNEELARFVYAVSHDLRSPLVTIKTFLGYLQEQDLPGRDSAAVAKDFSYINTAADKMSRMLDELLSLSRLERQVGKPCEIPLRALLEEACALVAGRMSGRGVRTRLSCEAATLFGVETVTLYGDRRRLLDVFQNLFDNAAKFMGEQPDPLIEAGVDLSGAEPVFFVRDNGIGLDSRHANKIFGLFEKLNPEMEGMGMGLALVRRIIATHGGRVWAESEGPGKGTTFRFTLADTKKTAGGE